MNYDVTYWLNLITVILNKVNNKIAGFDTGGPCKNFKLQA